MRKILVVEDDALVRKFVQSQLDDLGYSVLVASSGREALDLLKSRNDVDLLFTDVIMPGGISGPQLVAAATAMHPALRILYTSGYIDDESANHHQMATGMRLLRKPYRRAELARQIRAVLEVEKSK